MNPKKFKTVEHCDQRLAWLELEIDRIEENVRTGFVSEKSDIAKRGESMKREQSRLFARREALKTNELPGMA
ncbi:MAG: hypothetical protein ABSE90_07180 [Verrucomicrobiota bacterium]|jgi:hypothetical protein